MHIGMVIQTLVSVLFHSDSHHVSRSPGRGRENVKTETNTAYGVVSRREDPEYEVIGLSQSRHHNATN